MAQLRLGSGLGLRLGLSLGARAVRSCLPSLPWAILKPRMVGRRCSALSAAAARHRRSHPSIGDHRDALTGWRAPKR